MRPVIPPLSIRKLLMFNKRNENITSSKRHLQMPPGCQFLCFCALLTLATHLLITTYYPQLQLLIITLFVCLAFSPQPWEPLESSGFILLQCPFSTLRPSAPFVPLTWNVLSPAMHRIHCLLPSHLCSNVSFLQRPHLNSPFKCATWPFSFLDPPGQAP